MPLPVRGTSLPPTGCRRLFGHRLAAPPTLVLIVSIVPCWPPCGDPASIGTGVARAAENPPTVADAPFGPATRTDGGTGAAASSGESPANPFQTEEISIGQPITLPLSAPAGTGVPAAGTSSASQGAVVQASETIAEPPAAADAGSGWLGLAVDDALLTGRLVIVEVAPDSPAARAGVRPQDVLLAIDGNPLQSSDQLAAALAAITPGQRVKMAIGRDNRVEDVVALASRRPAANSRPWQSADPASLAAVPASPSVPDRPGAGGVAPGRFPPLASGATLDGGRPPESSSPDSSPMPASPDSPAPSSGGAKGPSGRTALGVRTIPVDTDVQSRFQLSDRRGAFVIAVVHDLPAAKAGVPPGSVIVAIDQRPVGSPQELTQLVTSGPIGTPVSLRYVLPGGQSKEAAVVLQPIDSPLERVLVGGGEFAPAAEPPRMHPAPSLARRPASIPTGEAVRPEPLARIEALMRRINGRLEQIERRLDRLDASPR